MQVVVWIIIILVVIFLIWLLRRWIRRLIFILILLVLAFFIYGIFNPSGAARLWYNVRTFPQRMASWMSPDLEFLDYDNYKIDVSSIGGEIGDKLGLSGEEIDLDLGDNTDIEIEEDNKKEKFDENDVENNGVDGDSQSTECQTIKSFPKSVRFVELPNVKDENIYENESNNIGPLTGYSKSDLIGIIDTYIERNLDDDTDILVTVEYEDDNLDPQKIILQTQLKG